MWGASGHENPGLKALDCVGLGGGFEPLPTRLGMNAWVHLWR